MAEAYKIRVAGSDVLEFQDGKIGLFGKTPVVPFDFIRDADGSLADITTKFNALLAGFQERGDMGVNPGSIVTKSIGAGLDYETLTEWQADNFGCQAGDQAVAQVTGTIAQVPITITNTTPQSIIIEAAAGQKHTGIPGTGARLASTSYSALLNINCGSIPVTVRDLELDHNAKNPTDATIIVRNAAILTLDSCLIYGSNSSRSTPTYLVQVAGPGTTTLTMTNNILCNSTHSGASSLYGLYCGVAAVLKVYNNTITNLDASNAAGSCYGISIADSTVWQVYRNNLVTDITASGGGTAKCYYLDTVVNNLTNNNLSDDATSPDVDYRSKTIGFANAVGNDYHLAVTDTDAIGMGVGPEILSDVPIEDIDGDTRSGSTTDIGADQYAA